MLASSIQLRKLWWVGPLTVVASIIGVLIVRAIAMAILPPPYAPGLQMIVISIVLTLVFCSGGGARICPGWTFREKAGAHFHHYFVRVPCGQLPAGYCGCFDAHARRWLAVFDHFDDNARGRGLYHRIYVDQIDRGQKLSAERDLGNLAVLSLVFPKFLINLF